jgi:hypothetical protein
MRREISTRNKHKTSTAKKIAAGAGVQPAQSPALAPITAATRIVPSGLGKRISGLSKRKAGGL